MKNFLKIIISFFSFFIVILIPIFLIIWQYNLFFPKTENLYFKNYQEKVMGYLLNKDDLLIEMNELEVSHMKDVKNLILYAMIILLFSLIFLIFSYLILKRKNKLKLFYNSLKLSSFYIIILIIFLLLTISNFDFVFIVFHEILFPQGNWLFPASSEMIQAFPESLFKKLFIYSLLMSSFLSTFLYLLILKINRKK